MPVSTSNSVVLAGGGTAGHTSPLIATAQELARLRPDEEAAAALDGAASRLADAVRERLSAPPGSAHDAPWRRTGALQASVGHVSDGLAAAVGSASPVAAAQARALISALPSNVGSVSSGVG